LMADPIAPEAAQAPAAPETADPNVSTPPAGSEQPAASPEPAVPAEVEAIGETPAAPAETVDPEPPPKRRTAEDRIKELVAERNALRELLGKTEKPKAEPAPAIADKVPAIEDFENVNEWAAAFSAFQEAIAAQVVERHLGKVKQREQIQTVQQQFVAREAEFAKSVPDYAVMVSDDGLRDLVTPTISEVVIASEIGPALSYHLATHRDELEVISKLSPAQQGVALGKLEVRLSNAPKQAPKPAPKKQQTQAPAPPSPVGGSPASKRIEDMPLDEYLASRTWASGNR
jgi:hypothetical protein